MVDADKLPRTTVIERRRVFKNGRLSLEHTRVEVVRTKDLESAPTVDAVVLPCKLGDTVWAIRNFRGVKNAVCGKVGEMFYTQNMRLMIVVHFVARGEWGKTVFATQEEAEAAIGNAKMDGDET